MKGFFVRAEDELFNVDEAREHGDGTLLFSRVPWSRAEG